MENKETIESLNHILRNSIKVSVRVMELENKIKLIDDKLNQLILIKKDVLSLKEACEYLSISESHMYKYTMNNSIICFRPNGKKIYFKRSDLDNWMLTNK